MTYLSNDNSISPAPRHAGPDPHGQAAILLVESLIHDLIARSALSGKNAIELVTVAVDVKMEIAAERGDNDDQPDLALDLLSAIRESLNVDFG